MNNQEETYNNWLTEDWLLNEIERTPNQEQRLLRLYEYFKLQADYEGEVENNE